MNTVFHPGEVGGAIPNGTRVMKVGSLPGDTHTDGALATVRSSHGPIKLAGHPRLFGYFVEWDDFKGLPVFIVGNRIQAINRG